MSIFFRDTELSDHIGFRAYSDPDPARAADDFLQRIKARFAGAGPETIVSIVLDGENAWSAYREDARPFLRALYGLLERDAEVCTVTFSEYLDGKPVREIEPHPLEGQRRVYDLFTGSWIDEFGPAPGVNLGTWIGEPEENRAWELPGQTRDVLSASGMTPEAAVVAYEAHYLAEGSDWFWWFGGDQDSGDDGEFDDLFHMHLQGVYRGLELEPPSELDQHLVPHVVLWTFARPVQRIQAADRLMIRTNCPGVLRWHADQGETREAELSPIGGVMASVRRYQLTLDPFGTDTCEVRFRFICRHPGCPGGDICCSADDPVVAII